MEKKQQQPDVSELWIQHQRRNNKATPSWACVYCPNRQIFGTEVDLWEHAKSAHSSLLPVQGEGDGGDEMEVFRKSFAMESALKKPNNREDLRKPNFNEATRAQPEPPPTKRPLSSPGPHLTKSSVSALGVGALNLGTPRGNDDTVMRDLSEEDQGADQPRKRAAIGDGISAGSGSPYHRSSASPPPRRSKARPTSAPYSPSETEPRRQDTLGGRGPQGGEKQLWSPDDAPPIRSSFVDPSNTVSVQAKKNRAQIYPPKTRKGAQQTPQFQLPRTQGPQNVQKPPPAILNRNSSTSDFPSPQDESYDIILQPETRPISQEQLVAEVKGIYAGLVMVEAKCIEVDNKQATLAQADPGAQPKLNNEQWQALIALHRTLLHEHHDFFLASQHPSASPALRRLASKYAMPARMWRHGIHSFLELLRHRLPASLDHMLAFIYLAYSMMALLYETVPAFEDTWIECLGDLGRYRMAIEDDDIRDREVWTGVARHWYSKASDKAPTTGRLYHHLAILARPNALQQLFYYSKSLCVMIPFVSARDSILTLFEPVLSTENTHGQYRLPPLDMAFVKAHGLLFTNKNMDKFEPTVQDFLGLLNNQIGRVTRKFMEQGYYIAVANSVAMLGFATKGNPLMQAMTKDGTDQVDTEMAGTTTGESDLLMTTFKNAQRLSNTSLEIVLQRIGDPNVLPYVHVTLVFMYQMARHPRAMHLLEAEFPWQTLVVMLNTLLGQYPTPPRIENPDFPLPVKDDVRPFTEDFAMRGLLFADGYYPEQWFANDKIDDEEKYLEVASMTNERKERILWLACRIASLGNWIYYHGDKRQFSLSPMMAPSPTTLSTRTTPDDDDGAEPGEGDVPLSNASCTSASNIARSETWPSKTDGGESSSDEEGIKIKRQQLGDSRLSPGKPPLND